MTLEDELTALVVKHCGWLDLRVDEISSCVDRQLVDDVNPLPFLARAQELTHQITGTSGSMGFAEVSQAAAELDRHFMEILGDKTGTVNEANIRRATELLEDLRATAALATPDSSTLCAELAG